MILLKSLKVLLFKVLHFLIFTQKWVTSVTKKRKMEKNKVVFLIIGQSCTVVLMANLKFKPWTGSNVRPPHCRFLVPGNSTKILQDIWHQFWHKNDGKWSHWNYFQILRALSELPANWPGQFSQNVEIFFAIPWHQKLRVYVEESLKSCCLFFKNMHSMQWPHKEGLPKVNAFEMDGQAEYRLFFLRSTAQFFTQIYMNCSVSS